MKYVRTPGFDIDLRRLPAEHCKLFVVAQDERITWLSERVIHDRNPFDTSA